MNLFLGTFDRVLQVMADTVGVQQVVSQRGLLTNLRLKHRLRDDGVGWMDLRDRAEFKDWCVADDEYGLCVVAGFSYILPESFITPS